MLKMNFDASYSSAYSSSELNSSPVSLSPTAELQRGKETPIVLRTVPCSLGFLLVAATPKGLCSVALGDSAEQLVATLHLAFPEAEINASDALLIDWTDLLLAHLSGHQHHLDLPLDVPATAFQRRVWQILQSINYGDTRSYSQVAEMLGQLQAVRAVARACATNPVALVVPCHRVLRSDGSLGGFRWGLERKQALLAQERQHCSARQFSQLSLLE